MSLSLRLPNLHELLTVVVSNSVALAIACWLHEWLALANLSLIFLTAVLACAILTSSYAALLSSVVSFITFNFFFTTPYFSLAVYEREQLLTLLFFLLIALVVGKTAGDSRKRMLALNASRLAEEQEQLRSALLASVSHDLRTPLASIIGATSSLRTLDEQLSRQDRFELLDGVLSESERLNRYIQNLLDMTRLGHGELAIERDWVAFDDLVTSAIKRLANTLVHLKIEQQWATDTLPLLYVNPALIEQALVNVIENAARFSPCNGVINIAAAESDDGQTLLFSVTDQGPGIPPEMRAQVFEMFFTGNQGDRSLHGSGLGLAICRGMLGAHQGKVYAETGPNGIGTQIIMILPLATENQEPIYDA
ncbi:ATP-binding protein [Vreelandella alkaliphila]|uniref:ATP-binding protein n=1 Tax=Halomonadaceae TaxID=28256 RepID=UPI001E5B4128|nr:MULTISPECIES: ATP-binding protein [Halomonas]MCD6006072.1 PAS domain-containing sensor histidine kinase [Halomonas sp. IOP_6]MCD6438200.1 PAS domain-containing sensor histidine kinase [Halomonas sp.]